MKTTLAQALADAATAVHNDRRKANEQYGAGLYDRAVEHHTRRRLTANLQNGSTRDVDGEQSRFQDYDHPEQYERAPHFVYFDFFRGPIMNSVSRMARGLPA